MGREEAIGGMPSLHFGMIDLKVDPSFFHNTRLSYLETVKVAARGYGWRVIRERSSGTVQVVE
jgi:hypothetical protein